MNAAVVSWPDDVLSKDAFVEKVYREGTLYYRALPWRYLNDPYAVLVSEVMLQQTQVSRVLKYWDRWMDFFPTLDALAAADVACVLERWQGLGYNRRALALKRTAEICVQNRDATLPTTEEHLRELPGVGPATAAGIMAFAYDRFAVYIETNVRTVFLHELFGSADNITDGMLSPLVATTCPDKNVRRWYYALLDYGAHLKACGINASQRSAHYTLQSSFEGSHRQKRAEILRWVLAHPGISKDELGAHLIEFESMAKREVPSYSAFESIVDELMHEGFFHEEDGRYLI